MFTEEDKQTLSMGIIHLSNIKYEDYFRLLNKIALIHADAPMSERELGLLDKNGVEMLMSGDLATVEDSMIFMAKGMNRACDKMEDE